MYGFYYKFALVLACSTSCSDAFAGTALLHTGSATRSDTMRTSPSQPLTTIPLRKQYVPVTRNNRTVAYKTAYFGQVSVGTPEPQVFTVVFDTGSGHFILPSASCKSEACLKHRRYDRKVSLSAVDIEYDGTPINEQALERDQVAIAFGTGEVLGEFLKEVVCIGAGGPASGRSKLAKDSCVTLRVVLATEMTPDPFSLFAFDGVLGIGLSALTLNDNFSFFGQMVAQHPTMLPRFSVFLAVRDEDQSAISFGGHDERRASTEIMWAPVAMEQLGYWQVWIKSVRMDDTVLEECADGQCRAVLDTGTSLLGVPRQTARSMHRHLARPVPNPESYSVFSNIDCRTVPGKKIHFDLGGPVVSLSVEDYSRPTPFNVTVPGHDAGKLYCRSLLLPVDMEPPLGPKVFIWGEPVLRRYLTIYDMAEKRIGFSVAKQGDIKLGEEGAATADHNPPSVFGTGPDVTDRPPADSLLPGAPLGSMRSPPPAPTSQAEQDGEASAPVSAAPPNSAAAADVM